MAKINKIGRRGVRSITCILKFTAVALSLCMVPAPLPSEARLNGVSQTRRLDTQSETESGSGSGSDSEVSESSNVYASSEPEDEPVPSVPSGTEGNSKHKKDGAKRKPEGSNSGSSGGVTASGGTQTQSSSSGSGGESVGDSEFKSSTGGEDQDSADWTPGQKSIMALLASAVVGGVALVLVAAKKSRKRDVKPREHPLKGALNRRIEMFSNLADRAEKQGDHYVKANDHFIVV